jgi:lysophospholipase L1-like esterase
MGDLAVFTIFFGANDSVAEGETQHVPLGEYKENLLRIIQYLRSVSPETFIVLLSPPTVNTKQWPTRSPSVVSDYANVCRELYIDEKSRGSKISLLDLGHLTEEDLRDGLHLNRSGNLKVFNLLKEFFEKTFPQLVGESALHQPHYPLSSSFSGKSVEELKREITEWTWGNTITS